MSARTNRTKKLIKPRLQLKLGLVFTLLGATLLTAQSILLRLGLQRIAERAPAQELDLYPHIHGVVLGPFLISLALLVPLFLGVAVLISHRIAGPVYRLEQHLARVAAGEDPGPCRIREGDELQELCASLNHAITALSERRAQASPPADVEGPPALLPGGTEAPTPVEHADLR